MGFLSALRRPKDWPAESRKVMGFVACSRRDLFWPKYQEDIHGDPHLRSGAFGLLFAISCGVFAPAVKIFRAGACGAAQRQ